MEKEKPAKELEKAEVEEAGHSIYKEFLDCFCEHPSLVKRLVCAWEEVVVWFSFKYTPVNFQIFITHVNLFIFSLKEKKTLQMAQWVKVPAANSWQSVLDSWDPHNERRADFCRLPSDLHMCVHTST